MRTIRPNNYSVNFHLTPHFDSKNPFLPTKVPRIPLTNTERQFLRLYLPFARGMKALCEFKTRRLHKEIEIADYALLVVVFLHKNPFCNKKVTKELSAFLFETSRSLLGFEEEAPPPLVIKPQVVRWHHT